MRREGEVSPPTPNLLTSPWGCGPPPSPLFLLPDAVPLRRFEGQQRWLCADSRGRWSPEVLQFHHVPVVAVDLSGSQLTYDGLDNCGEPPPLPRDTPGPHSLP